MRPFAAAHLLLASFGFAGCGQIEVSELRRGSQCGPTLDFAPVNEYAGDLPWIQLREDAVVIVNGSCSGTWIAAANGPVVLTAGHCVGLGDRVFVSFNFETDADGSDLVSDGTVIERLEAPDYALIALDELPELEPTPLGTRATARLAVIQHPLSRPKVVAEGDWLGDEDGQIRYADLDTLVGSSGVGVLGEHGRLLGVHTDGDCDEAGGSNWGWTTRSIVQASLHLDFADIEDC